MVFFNRYAETILGKIPSNRMLSLDVFRGLTITAMILVNNPGSWSYVYAPLSHAQWHGWTPTDLIFPFFIFIVGVSISLSVAVMHRKGVTKSDITRASAIRAAKLFALGLFLALFYFNFVAGNYDWLQQRLYSIRILGVLQRIAIVYLFCVVAYLYLPKRYFYSLAPALLLIYTGLMLYMPYSDAEGNVYQGLLVKGNNLAAWLDHMILTTRHVYDNTTYPFSYDPEGLLSTLPAIVSCISGVAVGEYLQNATHSKTPLSVQIKKLLAWGVVLTVSGWLLDGAFPINKQLWSPTFVLVSSGIAILSLALCIYIIDYRSIKTWTAPFIVFGANSIAFYMFAGIVERVLLMVPVQNMALKEFLFSHVYQPLLGNYNGSLAWSFTFLIMSYGVFHYMYKKDIIWKV